MAVRRRNFQTICYYARDVQKAGCVLLPNPAVRQIKAAALRAAAARRTRTGLACGRCCGIPYQILTVGPGAIRIRMHNMA
jgi:hypothetical protein